MKRFKIIFLVIWLSQPHLLFGEPKNNEIRKLSQRYELCVLGVVVPDKDDPNLNMVKEKEVFWSRRRPKAEGPLLRIAKMRAFPIGAQVVRLYDYDRRGARITSLVNEDGTVALGENLVISIDDLRTATRWLRKAEPKRKSTGK